MKSLTKLFAIILLLFLALQGFAQNKELKGIITSQEGEPLIGATIMWEGTTIGAVADENGSFQIPKMNKPALLLIQYVGYETVKIEMLPDENEVEIQLQGNAQLQTVNVTGQSRDNYTSTLATINLESISSCELKKAACCNLAESFETNGAVDVMQQDAVTSTTEVQMLGLRGVYTQLLLEKRPVYTGLGSPYALEYIPGTWVSDIQISKGASTVQNGYSALAGQINVELVKPWLDKPFFLNLFGSTKERGEINLHLNKKWTEQWSSGILLHGSANQGVFDRNDDTFMDAPKKKNIDGIFRTFYRGDIVSAQINVQALIDERRGGQIIPENASNLDDYYRTNQDNKRLDVFGKVGYYGFAEPNTSIGFIYNASWHETNNTFGKRSYNGDQKNLYANLIYSTSLPDEHHRLNFGASYQYDRYNEFLDEADYSREEIVPGVFGEYVYGATNAGGDSFWEGVGIIAGLRVDNHNKFGWLYTPRLNLKYNFTDQSVVRLSAGRGLRTAQVLSENMAVLASNRVLALAPDLDMEDAWNYGFNYTRNFKFGERSASFIIDAYRTQFTNQIVLDVESEMATALFYNVEGKSFSNSLLFLTSVNLAKGLDVKLAYKFNDVQITYQGILRQRPMNARHRALTTIDYETPGEKWMFNTNIQFTGKQRFADMHHVPFPSAENFLGTTPAYVILNVQVTRRFKMWELYAGGENLTNYTQKHAILDWENPFSEYFDAMQVWAPLVGIRGYAGIRFWLD